jgi:hypothetical protein
MASGSDTMTAMMAIGQAERVEASTLAEHVPVLSDLEWKVVSLALREAGQAVTGEPGPLARRLRALWRAVTGWEPKRPLADPRLEALRRFVCTQRGRRDAADLAARLMGMGFTQNQLSAVTLLARR